MMGGDDRHKVTLKSAIPGCYYIRTFNYELNAVEYLVEGDDGKLHWSLSGIGIPDLYRANALLMPVLAGWAKNAKRDIPLIEWREH